MELQYYIAEDYIGVVIIMSLPSAGAMYGSGTLCLLTWYSVCFYLLYSK